MTAIDDKHAALGGNAGFLGSPVIPESPTPDGVGRFRHYQGGSIYWTPATGAHEVHGAIRGKWQQLGWETGPLGYPITDEMTTPDGVGRFNHFRKGLGPFEQGSIYWTPATGAHEVHGAIRALWAQLGWELSSFGYPVTDETLTEHEHGRFNDFQHGSIYWDAGRGAYELFPAPPPVTPQPAAGGQWQVPAHRSGVVGVHAVLLHTNKVLFFTYREPPVPAEVPQPQGESAVLDLATSTIARPPGPPEPPPGDAPNLFCGGHAFLSDGRVLVAGGERQQPALRGLHTFTPSSTGPGTWRSVGKLAAGPAKDRGRWYPTCVTLADGRVLIMGGDHWPATAGPTKNATFEVYDPATGLQPDRPAPIIAEAPSTYPFVFVLPSGKVLVHAGTRTAFLDPSTGTFDATRLEAAGRPRRAGRTYDLQGTSVLLPLLPTTTPPYRARVMVIGGGGVPKGIRTVATETCEVLDTGASPLAWRLVASMVRPRVMPDAVLLPDATVLVMNGSSTGYADNGANPVFDTELYDPAADSWSMLASMKVPRLYHATALLLPDGRVMTAGTDATWQPDPHRHGELRVELFSPPYLFRGPRPSITSAPAEVGYGATFQIGTPDPAAVQSVALLRCGSCTHSFNSDQRYVGCTITARAAANVTVQAPPNGNVAPPGHYLLFVLNANRVPSVARFLRVR